MDLYWINLSALALVPTVLRGNAVLGALRPYQSGTRTTQSVGATAPTGTVGASSRRSTSRMHQLSTSERIGQRVKRRLGLAIDCDRSKRPEGQEADVYEASAVPVIGP